jgi:hypothetical protein
MRLQALLTLAITINDALISSEDTHRVFSPANFAVESSNDPYFKAKSALISLSQRILRI